MTATVDVCSLTAIQIIRAAPLFDRLVDAVLEYRSSQLPTRRTAAVQNRAELDAALRERLDWFFPRFRDLYFDLLRGQLGSDLSSVLEALQDERVQRFLRAVETMRPALLGRMQQLGREMAAALDASSFSACSGSTSAA
jgi:hypothetical protein